MKPDLEVLIPTCERPLALAVTLTSLAAQSFRSFAVIISDQSEYTELAACGELQAALRFISLTGHPVEVIKHVPKRGIAEQRNFLLGRAAAQHVLFLDDDLMLAPETVERLHRVMRRERCGFAGAAPIGLSYVDDVRPDEQQIEFWEGPVRPETVRPGASEWSRFKLHNAANLLHVERRAGLSPGEARAYKVAWVGSCVLYDRAKLEDVGGFSFWRQLPADHCGEDAYAQLRVMAKYGGCGVLPSGVYHQELPTTLADRTVNAPEVLLANHQAGDG